MRKSAPRFEKHKGWARHELTSGSRPKRFHCTFLSWYIGTEMSNEAHIIERVQTGVRMEKRVLKVLKGLAEFHDMTLGDLLEGIVLHAFDGKSAFQRESLTRIRQLKEFYGLDLDSRASHKLTEAGDLRPRFKKRTRGTRQKLRKKGRLRK